MKDQPSLGAQEMALMRFVGERQPISMREAADEFGEPNGLARTTVLTMLERLRKKRVLLRAKKGGIFFYRLAGEQTEVLHGLVQSFVEKTLGGSITPFVAYLTQSKSLTSEEMEALEKFVIEMKQSEVASNES
jgi:predicted transcriptional regulator